MTNSISQSWHNCYSEPWTNIQPEAFAHPAKFSSALIRRIYQHALERGYLKPGDTVLDPFGGIGLGSRDALANGLNWLGCELEQRFVDMGTGLECSGISKADWVRFYGRWEKMAHKDGHAWCPRCLAEARQVTENKGGGQLSFVEPLPSAAYSRNSGLIPETRPHYYQGNLDLFKKYARGRAWAVLLQGDSRKLVEIVSLRMGAMRSSPPYANISPEKNSKGVDLKKNFESYKAAGGGMDYEGYCRIQAKHSQGYGSTPGQLSVLKEGSLPAAISSPPYESYTVHKNGIDASKLQRPGHNSQAITMDDYGITEGQLGAMPKGGFEAAIGSPPYANGEKGHPSLGSVNKDSWGNDGRDITRRRGLSGEYGAAQGQLANLPEGSVEATISSPPFVSSVGSDDPDKRGGLFRDPKRRNDRNLTGSYGETEGQLGAMAQGEFDGAISSPPFTEAQTGGTAIYDQLEITHKRRISPELRRSGYRADLQGDTPGQLGAMPAGEPVEQMAGMISSPPFMDNNVNVGAVGDTPAMRQQIHNSAKRNSSYGSTPGQLGGMAATRSSPPFEASLESKDEKFNGLARPGRTIQRADYGSTEGQLGQESKETFWQAARQIVEQVYCLLKPGGVTIWVCKDFVRDGKLVPFCDQWRQLCEACGFEHLETFRAMLVKDNGKQYGLDGGEVHLTKERKSFFRRLAEKKGSPRIDWEEVIILQKPGLHESDDQAHPEPVQLGLEAAL